MTSIDTLIKDLSVISDFRKPRGKRYALVNILSIFILSVISGADDYVSIAAYAKSKQVYLRDKGLLTANRIPSHDLFRQILQSLDNQSFAKLLAVWLSRMVEQPRAFPTSSVEPKYIHIDGKSLRATRKGNEHTRSALQIVTAYYSNNSISVGQCIIDKKSCEKTAIPSLIKMLDLKDSLVTIDAIATTRANAKLIIEKQADYLLALKKNNKHLYLEVEGFFKHMSDTALIVDYFESNEQGHGRKERRICRVIECLSSFPDAQDWSNLQCIICIESHRTVNNKTSIEKRYYLSSLPANARILAKAIRKHWTVENELHWSLDVSFNEDKCTIRDKNAAANFAMLRRFALATLKNAKISKLGIKNQRLQAAWDDKFAEKILEFLNKKNIL